MVIVVVVVVVPDRAVSVRSVGAAATAAVERLHVATFGAAVTTAVTTTTTSTTVAAEWRSTGEEWHDGDALLVGPPGSGRASHCVDNKDNVGNNGWKVRRYNKHKPDHHHPNEEQIKISTQTGKCDEGRGQQQCAHGGQGVTTFVFNEENKRNKHQKP